MRTTLKRIGNSSGIDIPMALLAEIGAKVGDEVEIIACGGQLLIAPVPFHPRAGWAEASRLIASEELGQDSCAWLDFVTDGDRDLSW